MIELLRLAAYSEVAAYRRLANPVRKATSQWPGTNWTEACNSPTQHNERLSITDEGTAPQQFYRLRKKE